MSELTPAEIDALIAWLKDAGEEPRYWADLSPDVAVTLAEAFTAEREARETAETQAKNAADDMWTAVIRADGLEAEIARRDEEVAALRAAREKAEAERDEAIRALAEEGRKRGAAEAERDAWNAVHTRQAEQTRRAEAEAARLREAMRQARAVYVQHDDATAAERMADILTEALEPKP